MLNTSSTTRNDNWIEALGIRRAKIPVLIIGNNPIEITSVFDVLMSIRTKSYFADVCFDVRDSFNRIAKSKPELVLIDDNLMIDDVRKLVRVLKQNSKTKDIKIIVLKSNNWNYAVIDHVDDYIIKDTIDAAILDKVIEKNLNPLEPEFA
jgi:CheY-like chemotaxis protein